LSETHDEVAVREDPIAEAISRRAAEWFAAQHGGSPGKDRREAFFEWLRASPVHVEEYLAIAATDRSLEKGLREHPVELAALIELARQDRGAEVRTLSVRPSLRRVPLRAVTAIAATALVCLAVLVPAARWWRDGSVPPDQVYRTAHGSRARWQLADGSVLHLDSDSVVAVRFASRERLLTLERGQALFEVVHEPRPFRVRVGGVVATAVGTRFDIDRRPEVTRVTVLDGRIVVADQRAGSAGQGRAGPDEAARSLTVGPGEQVQFPAAGAPIGPVSVDPRQAIAWLERRVIVEQRPLSEIIAEFNRNNRVQMVLTDPALGSMVISGAFNADDLDSFVAFLSSLEGVRVTRTTTTITIGAESTAHHR
jgi:transmembrane sensor